MTNFSWETSKQSAIWRHRLGVDLVLSRDWTCYFNDGTFKRIAEALQGQPVTPATIPLVPPVYDRNEAATWRCQPDWIRVTAAAARG